MSAGHLPPILPGRGASDYKRYPRTDDLLALLRRACHCLRFITDQVEMLEHMSPWEYQEIRTTLGHGSGFDSPGFRRVRRASPALGKAFHRALGEAELTLVGLYQNGREHGQLYQLAELLSKTLLQEMGDARNALTGLANEAVTVDT